MVKTESRRRRPSNRWWRWRSQRRRRSNRRWKIVVTGEDGEVEGVEGVTKDEGKETESKGEESDTNDEKAEEVETKNDQGRIFQFIMPFKDNWNFVIAREGGKCSILTKKKEFQSRDIYPTKEFKNERSCILTNCVIWFSAMLLGNQA